MDKKYTKGDLFLWKNKHYGRLLCEIIYIFNDTNRNYSKRKEFILKNINNDQEFRLDELYIKII